MLVAKAAEVVAIRVFVVPILVAKAVEVAATRSICSSYACC